MHALWALVGGGPLSVEFHQALLDDDDPGFGPGAFGPPEMLATSIATIADKVVSLAADPAADVRLQVAIAATKLDGVDPLPVLLDVLAGSGDDPLMPHIVWQNLHPLLEEHGQRSSSWWPRNHYADSHAVTAHVPRAIDRVLACRDPRRVLALVDYAARKPQDHQATLSKCLAQLDGKAAKSRTIHSRTWPRCVRAWTRS